MALDFEFNFFFLDEYVNRMENIFLKPIQYIIYTICNICNRNKLKNFAKRNIYLSI